MKKSINSARWIIHNFFTISMAIFIIIYMWWFRLTPLMFYNDPDGAYVVGLILLGLYGLFTTLTKLSEKRAILKTFLFIPTMIFFLGNIAHAKAFFPSVEFTTKCNGKTYYITWMHPFGDYQWTFDNVTIWYGPFKYDSFFFGYSGGGYEIICDSEKREANIINTFNDVLVYTDGENARQYDRYAGTRLKIHQYFLARQCNDWKEFTCGSETYTLYQCDIDYRSCDPLPVRYTEVSVDYLILEPDEAAEEINLYEEFFYNDERTLIFTYGEHPRCYVEGCEILEEQK